METSLWSRGYATVSSPWWQHATARNHWGFFWHLRSLLDRPAILYWSQGHKHSWFQYLRRHQLSNTISPRPMKEKMYSISTLDNRHKWVRVDHSGLDIMLVVSRVYKERIGMCLLISMGSSTYTQAVKPNRLGSVDPTQTRPCERVV